MQGDLTGGSEHAPPLSAFNMQHRYDPGLRGLTLAATGCTTIYEVYHHVHASGR